MSRKQGRERGPLTLSQFDMSVGDLLIGQRSIRKDFGLSEPERKSLTVNLQSLEQDGVQWDDAITILSSRGSLRLLGLLETGWDENASLVYGVCDADGSVLNGLRYSPARISGHQERIERVFEDIGSIFRRLPES